MWEGVWVAHPWLGRCCACCCFTPPIIAHPVSVQQLPRHADAPPAVHAGGSKPSVEPHSSSPGSACAHAQGGRADRAARLCDTKITLRRVPTHACSPARRVGGLLCGRSPCMLAHVLRAHTDSVNALNHLFAREVGVGSGVGPSWVSRLGFPAASGLATLGQGSLLWGRPPYPSPRRRCSPRHHHISWSKLPCPPSKRCPPPKRCHNPLPLDPLPPELDVPCALLPKSSKRFCG